MEKFQKMFDELKISQDKYFIRHRYLPPSEDFGITLSNRAGNLINSEYKIAPLKKSLSKRCNYPFYTFFIDYNGDVQMCSHDWAKKYILGNVKNQKIIDIWLNKKFQKCKPYHMYNNFICQHCDNHAFMFMQYLGCSFI